MITTDTKHRLFEVVLAFIEMYLLDYLDSIKKCVNVYSNYIFLVRADIIEGRLVEKEVEVPIDFIEGVQPFTITAPKSEEKTKKLTLLEISKDGFEVFPEGYEKSDEIKELKEDFHQFFVSTHIDKLLNLVLKTSQEKHPELKTSQKIIVEKFVKSVLNDNTQGIEDKELLNEIYLFLLKALTTVSENSLELEFGQFYILNELIASIQTGGAWYHLVIDSDYENVMPELDSDFIKLTGISSLTVDEKQYTEEILSLNVPWNIQDLAITGNDIISELALPPSPRIGKILDMLFKECVAHPGMNNIAALKKRAQEAAKGSQLLP